MPMPEKIADVKQCTEGLKWGHKRNGRNGNDMQHHSIIIEVEMIETCFKDNNNKQARFTKT